MEQLLNNLQLPRWIKQVLSTKADIKCLCFPFCNCMPLDRAKILVSSLNNKQTNKSQDPIGDYVHLTKNVMPSLALTAERNWPVREDHCFQRIVLDTICGGVWYEHLERPAYRNLTIEQAQRAVRLCRDIIEGSADLWQLNRQSLIWRRKKK